MIHAGGCQHSGEIQAVILFEDAGKLSDRNMKKIGKLCLAHIIGVTFFKEFIDQIVPDAALVEKDRRVLSGNGKIPAVRRRISRRLCLPKHMQEDFLQKKSKHLPAKRQQTAGLSHKCLCRPARFGIRAKKKMIGDAGKEARPVRLCKGNGNMREITGIGAAHVMIPRQDDEGIAAGKRERLFPHGNGARSGKNDVQLKRRVAVPLLMPRGKILEQIVFQGERAIGGRRAYSVFCQSAVHKEIIPSESAPGYTDLRCFRKSMLQLHGGDGKFKAEKESLLKGA